MKNPFILIAAVFILWFPAFSQAQSSPAIDSNTTKSLDMAKSMLKATTGLADDFINFKGDFIQKDKDNSFYSVKGLDIGATNEFVVVRGNGGSVFVAIFTGKDKQDKNPMLAFAAFTGGLMTISEMAKSTEKLTVTPDDTQPKGTLKYYLKVKDTKLASFTYDVEANQGTFLVAIQ